MSHAWLWFRVGLGAACHLLCGRHGYGLEVQETEDAFGAMMMSSDSCLIQIAGANAPERAQPQPSCGLPLALVKWPH